SPPSGFIGRAGLGGFAHGANDFGIALLLAAQNHQQLRRQFAVAFIFRRESSAPTLDPSDRFTVAFPRPQRAQSIAAQDRFVERRQQDLAIGGGQFAASQPEQRFGAERVGSIRIGGRGPQQ